LISPRALKPSRGPCDQAGLMVVRISVPARTARVMGSSPRSRRVCALVIIEWAVHRDDPLDPSGRPIRRQVDSSTSARVSGHCWRSAYVRYVIAV
jgi:hypothetical protein